MPGTVTLVETVAHVLFLFHWLFVLLSTHCAVLPAVPDYYRITVYYLDSSDCMITTS